MASWTEGKRIERKSYSDTKLKKFLRDYKKFNFIEKHFNEKILGIYTFLSYDFIEFGMGYYLQRIIHKYVKRN